jgi:hypothetical protein
MHSCGDGELKCTLCGWSVEAYKGYQLPSKSDFRLAAQDRGITWEQFDREWVEYQAYRVNMPVCNPR